MKRFLRFFKNTTVRIISFLLLVAFVASVFIYTDFYRKQVNKGISFYYVYKGDKFYKKNKPQDAINSYIRALELYPNHYKARYNLANLYVAYEDYYSAIDSYMQALEIKPGFTIARIDYAIVLSEAMFNYDRAISEYKIAVEKTPKWVYIPFIINNKNSYKYNKGVAYYNQGLAWRGKSILNGKNPILYRKYMQNSINSYEMAAKSLKSYDVYYNLALSNQLLKNYGAAGKSYCEAIKLDPMRYESHYNLAILFKSMKRYPESIEEFKRAGLILDISGGGGDKTSLVYSTLNDVNSLNVSLEKDEPKGEEEKEEEPVTETYVTNVGGKLVFTGDVREDLSENFNGCKKYSFED